MPEVQTGLSVTKLAECAAVGAYSADFYTHDDSYTNRSNVNIPLNQSYKTIVRAHTRVAPTLQVRTAGDKDVDDIRTLMEEVDMRIGETKKATYEFKRDIIMGGEDAHTGMISADKVVR